MSCVRCGRERWEHLSISNRPLDGLKPLYCPVMTQYQAAPAAGADPSMPYDLPIGSRVELPPGVRYVRVTGVTR